MHKRGMPDNFSPYKETKKGHMEPVDEDDVDKIVNSEVFNEMIKEKSHIFSEELMSFTVQVKKSGETGSRWSTAGKAPTIPPPMWGRYSAGKKEEFIDDFTKNF